MFFPRPQSKQLRFLAVVSIFTAGLAVYSLWLSPTVAAKNQSKKLLEKHTARINQIEIHHIFPDVLAKQDNTESKTKVQAATDENVITDSDTSTTPSPTRQTGFAAPSRQESKANPTQSTEATKVAANIPQKTQLSEQTQSALTGLSETFMTNLWNPPARSTQVYATDAFSPFTTRLLTLAAFLLIFSGAALRKFAYQKPKTAGAPLAAKKLAMSANN